MFYSFATHESVFELFLTLRELQSVRTRDRPVTIPSKVKFPRTMTSKGVKVQSKVTFYKPVTGFFALLQGGTSCFARRVKYAASLDAESRVPGRSVA